MSLLVCQLKKYFITINSRYINPPKRETQAAECRSLCLVIPTHQRQCLVDVHQMLGTTEHQILSEAPAIIVKQGREYNLQLNRNGNKDRYNHI